ncbi:subtilisin-like protease SBT1.8 [Amborella trichopoda]|uniref:Subtilisin-like protease n=1 Tax=Amborella trichopoda TaxID=13333 RepID=W1PTD0_AMBTC|nr:subtilisin-like protease SBT1.8 [Amborella trichopoda]ERN11298.1 hypothetical protein AMTR_s00024p00243520 [Amborella trichopoda]|eukprot:XP_006849717.1 subtilisin-like protease SBT1.8 [Amborella trichopoda]
MTQLHRAMAMAMALSTTTTHLLLFLSLSSLSLSSSSPLRVYIVRMSKAHMPPVFTTHDHWYASELQTTIDADANADSRLLYTYDSAFHGYAALLSPYEAEKLRSYDSVLAVYEEYVYELHTTRSPAFLGLGGYDAPVDMASLDQASEDVVIGVLDTGVWPESPSFSDAGMAVVPPKWQGACESGPDFPASACNRKLIGARSFSRGYLAAEGLGGSSNSSMESASPRDRDGHGTHTASTAAGAAVPGASLFGYARGTARGMAQRARVAVYKVCWSSGCFSSDILAGMDRAVTDGVDVLSLSLGGGAAPYYRDAIAIGAFSAAEKGVFVSCSAGNAGPDASTLANVAPWIATIGAGTLDRDFPAYVLLDNNQRFTGVSLYSGRGLKGKRLSIVYGQSSGLNSSNLCLAGTLDPKLVRGKIVLCDRGINARVEKGEVVRSAGGAGMILANTAANGEELVADSHQLPAVAVGKKAGDEIRAYVRGKSGIARATLAIRGTVLGVRPSPVVAAFSSRGPNMVTPQVLKPDVVGPGVNILAGWTGAAGPSGLAKDKRRTKFNIISGTSMSCPHISGVAALLKAAHPDWSPAAIKSALMTTAYTRDTTGSPLRDAATGGLSTPLAHGSGHVDPQNALDPGLIYDLSTSDYLDFLCSLNYSDTQVRIVSKHSNFSCPRDKVLDTGNLNYPSFSVIFRGYEKVVRYSRVLTNVGEPSSVYTVSVSAPEGVGITVKPQRLVFKGVGNKQGYTVEFASKIKTSGPMDFGWILWSNQKHKVRSPIAFSWPMSS